MNKLLKILAIGGIACKMSYSVDFPIKKVHGDVYIADRQDLGRWYCDVDATFYVNYIYIDVDNKYDEGNMYVSTGTQVIVYETEK